MKHQLSALLICVTALAPAAAESSEALIWATAVSKHATKDRAIVFRYAEGFREGFQRSSLSHRVILSWRYESPSGMPSTSEREAMERMEDLLATHVEKSGFALLTLVSTGENLREWVYYASSERAFLAALNDALAGHPLVPIEIQASPDPDWSTYSSFRRNLMK